MIKLQQNIWFNKKTYQIKLSFLFLQQLSFKKISSCHKDFEKSKVDN
jgi:hypothetical protein